MLDSSHIRSLSQKEGGVTAMLMNVLTWIVFGGVAGWVASLIVSTGGNQGCLMDIVVGIVGAVIGGFVVNLLMPTSTFTMVPGFHLESFIVAVLGAVVLLVVVKMLRSR
jgi:uncharacterized membrane protein YeaQ/YmgE (transglycosylase-associated protein family)